VGATATRLQHTVPIHPTVSELWPSVVGALRAEGGG